VAFGLVARRDLAKLGRDRLTGPFRSVSPRRPAARRVARKRERHHAVVL